eukprot:291360_1
MYSCGLDILDHSPLVVTYSNSMATMWKVVIFISLTIQQMYCFQTLDGTSILTFISPREYTRHFNYAMEFISWWKNDSNSCWLVPGGTEDAFHISLENKLYLQNYLHSEFAVEMNVYLMGHENSTEYACDMTIQDKRISSITSMRHGFEIQGLISDNFTFPTMIVTPKIRNYGNQDTVCYFCIIPPVLNAIDQFRVPSKIGFDQRDIPDIGDQYRDYLLPKFNNSQLNDHLFHWGYQNFESCKEDISNMASDTVDGQIVDSPAGIALQNDDTYEMLFYPNVDRFDITKNCFMGIEVFYDICVSSTSLMTFKYMKNSNPIWKVVTKHPLSPPLGHRRYIKFDSDNNSPNFPMEIKFRWQCKGSGDALCYIRHKYVIAKRRPCNSDFQKQEQLDPSVVQDDMNFQNICYVTIVIAVIHLAVMHLYIEIRIRLFQPPYINYNNPSATSISETTNINTDDVSDEDSSDSDEDSSGSEERYEHWEKHFNLKQVIDDLMIESYKYSQSINDDLCCIDNIDISKRLNHYLWLVQQYEDNEEKFNFIMQNNQRKCDINTCQIFHRHHRNHRHHSYVSNVTSTEDEKSVDTANYQNNQIMDKIHIFCHHLPEIRERLWTKESNGKDKHMEARLKNKYNQFYNVFHLGIEFDYEDDDPHIEEEKQPTNTKQPSRIKVDAKYEHLKQELISNQKYRMTILQYLNEYKNATIHYNSQYRQHQYPNINEQHILALMIYCNYDKIQNVFSKSYREQNGSNHTYFYQMGKLLKEAVIVFGTTVQDGYEHVKKFYHGVNQKLVPEEIVGNRGTGISILCPLSTSASFAVAANFCNFENGLIMTFGGNTSEAKYFSVAWLSNYQYEKEYLFLQNKAKLQIINITDPANGITEYDCILNALNALDSILHQTHYYQDERATVDDHLLRLIMQIVKHQLYKTTEHKKGKKFRTLTKYGRKLCEKYFETKKLLIVDHLILKKRYATLFDLICLTDYNWVDFAVLTRIFPSIEDIEIRNVCLCPQIMENILKNRSIFRFGRGSWCLNKMIIKGIKNNCFTASDAVKKYETIFKKHTTRLNIRAVDCDSDYDILIVE